MKIPLVKSTFYRERDTLEHLEQFINERHKQLSMGEQCAAFESAFAHKQGRKHAVLVSSGGAANLGLLQSLKNLRILDTGARIGFSSVTWSTNVMPIIQLGFIPVPLDVQPNTLNLSIDSVLRNIETLDAVFVTNALGFCTDLKRLQYICAANDVLLIEDNCESLGTETDDEMKTGNAGLASTFSFYVAHHLSTIEGGMVCTDSDALADMLRIVRSNGWDRDVSSGRRSELRSEYSVDTFNALYTFYALAYNLKPTEITGVIGCTQMKYYDEIMQRRESNYMEIARVIRGNTDLIPNADACYTKIPAFAIPIVCNSHELRTSYLESFAAAGIETRPIISGDTTQQPYYAGYNDSTKKLTGARYLRECGFYCGNSPEYSEEDIQTIIGCIE